MKYKGQVSGVLDGYGQRLGLYKGFLGWELLILHSPGEILGGGKYI